jgi:hypothetical protein
MHEKESIHQTTRNSFHQFVNGILLVYGRCKNTSQATRSCLCIISGNKSLVCIRHTVSNISWIVTSCLTRLPAQRSKGVVGDTATTSNTPRLQPQQTFLFGTTAKKNLLITMILPQFHLPKKRQHFPKRASLAFISTTATSTSKTYHEAFYNNIHDDGGDLGSNDDVSCPWQRWSACFVATPGQQH